MAFCSPYLHAFYFMVLKIFEKYEDGVFSSVCKRPLSLSITPNDQIRKAAWLMLLRFDCKASFIVWLTSVYLSHNTFKVCINSIWSFHLLIVVLRVILFCPSFGISVLVGLFSSPLHSGLCLSRRSLVVYPCKQRSLKCLLSLCLF